ncbi:MAG TPA: FAD-binding oxidoreductase [Nitrospinota bacterium]|jgi:glycolate oxidase FAD binding subunit|nr:FAD-binding oxidoreductase [Nitrospinota bacterium]HJP15138.1 FAD-binding oxidoreductase [Nitrospinota bacterium]
MTLPIDSFSSAVLADTGDAGLLTGEGASGFAIGGKAPALVARPGSHEDAARVLARASEAGLAVVPWGGGTGRRTGYPPERYDVALTTGRLSGAVDFMRDDLTAVVGAGMTISALNDLTTVDGQTAGIDPPHPDRATVGGAIVAGRSGPMRVRYGRARDRVMRMRIALADGSTQTYGALVVKNVTGYDMNRLLAGSWGTLALVTELAIRLYKMPERTGALAAGFPSAEAAFAAARKLSAISLSPMWVEALDAGRIAALAEIEGAEGRFDLPGPWCLSAAYGDFEEGLAEQLTRAEKTIIDAGGVNLLRLDAENTTRLGKALADPPGGEFAGEDALEFRASARLDQLPRFAVAGEMAARAGGYRIASAAHAASGIYRCWLAPDEGQTSPGAAWDTFREGCRAGAYPEWGRAVHVCLTAGAASDGGVHPGADIWGEDALDPPAVDLMRRIKAEYDPAGIFSPGRFIARI